MREKPILVIMAAGMGSRYGGLKQIDPVGRQRGGHSSTTACTMPAAPGSRPSSLSSSTRSARSRSRPTVGARALQCRV